jgi:hypothetical protein
MCGWDRRKEPTSRGARRSSRRARVSGRLKLAETAPLPWVGVAAWSWTHCCLWWWWWDLIAACGGGSSDNVDGEVLMVVELIHE